MIKRMDPSDLQRKVGNRDERVSDTQKIVISLKYFDSNQPKKDKQTYDSWQKDKRLSVLMERMEGLCNCSIKEAIQKDLIKKYPTFPPSEKTEFKCPTKFKDNPWFVIKRIAGQKARAAGVMVGNIFYIVFFDRYHRFWISKKKNT